MKVAFAIGAVLLMVGMSTIAAEVQEFQIRLNQHTQIPVGNCNLRIAIRDLGIDAFQVSFSYGTPLRFRKIKGFERENKNLTLIYSRGQSRVYYVDSLRASANMCILRVETDN